MMGDFIDFADITNQINRREMNRTYEFNLMLVGLKGVGKSTLVKSLFQGMIKPEETQKLQLNEYSELLEENGVKLHLRCIETSYYRSHSSSDYVKYIDEQFKSYFKSQLRQSSWNIKDTRIHCCLYLIPPYGKLELEKEDLDCMKALHEKVNLIPVIAKSDTFDSIELEQFKENILTALESNEIKYFKFQHDDKEDEERFRAVKVEAERFPFAIVAAKEPTSENKKTRWIRTSIYGQIDITDNSKCDFDALAKLLIRHCMLDLMDSTHVKHYALFKRELLETSRIQGGRNLHSLGLSPHEIKRIQDETNPAVKKPHMSYRRKLEKQRLGMELELKSFKQRLQTLENTCRNMTASYACQMKPNL